MTRAIVLISAAAVLIGIAAGAWLVIAGARGDRFADCRRTSVAGGTADVGGPFTLTDTTGGRVTAADVIDGPTLVYFGYSFCPDVCPLDLSRNAVAADLLAERGIDVGQVFITIDPARDTPEALATFTDNIHPDLVGLTGSDEDIAEAAGAYRVYYGKGEGEGDFYLMDHSTFTYLMAPEAGFLDFFPSDASPEAVADSVACFSERL
jgi:protein SCO1